MCVLFQIECNKTNNNKTKVVAFECFLLVNMFVLDMFRGVQVHGSRNKAEQNLINFFKYTNSYFAFVRQENGFKT